MAMKLLIMLVTVTVTVTNCEGKAALRRKPKVYNALITTDEDLVQSRAYPVIQPTIHESGIAHYGPYNPYGIYNPHVVRLAQPIAPALTPKEQISYPLPSPQFPPQLMHQPLLAQALTQPQPLVQNPPTAPASEKPQEPSNPPTDPEQQPQSTMQPPTMPMQPSEIPKEPSQPSKMPVEQLPIPLNQYGLPPSLIPLRQPQPYHPFLYGPSPNPPSPLPYHLPPYRFNQFPPLYYNTLPGLRQQFLPPYGFLPTGPQFPLSNAIPTDKLDPQSTQPPSQIPTAAPPMTTVPSEPPTEIVPPSEPEPKPEPSFENIKNGSKSKDSNVPDVPPPPIPSGAKAEQS